MERTLFNPELERSQDLSWEEPVEDFFLSFLTSKLELTKGQRPKKSPSERTFLTLTRVTPGTQSWVHSCTGSWTTASSGTKQTQFCTLPCLGSSVQPGKAQVWGLHATRNGREISILPSASGLQERASSRSRAVDGSMVKIQSFLGKRFKI
jgi:hypothetical protein